MDILISTGISEVHDIKFTQSTSRVSEDKGAVTVCAVSGKLAEEFTPVTVTVSTVSNTVKGKYVVITCVRVLDIWHSDWGQGVGNDHTAHVLYDVMQNGYGEEPGYEAHKI